MKTLRAPLKIGDLMHAVKILQTGGVVVYPTDTAYGLAVDATNIKAVSKLYRLKGRQFRKPIHVIFPSVAWLIQNVSLDALSLRLMHKFLPGPLTVVVKLKSKNKGLNKIKSPLGIGLRYPNTPAAQLLVELLGKPITATSANLSGGDNAYSITEVKRQFTQSRAQPDYYIDGGKLKKIKPSTIVSVVNNNVTILREGPITENQIKRCLR